MEIVTINPGLILGPNIIDGSFTSSLVIKRLMSGKIPGAAKLMFGIVDVRDVALAHLQAIKIKGAANQRFLLVNESLWIKQIMAILKEEFGKHYVIPDGEIRYITFRLASMFDASLKLALPFWDKK